MSEAPGHINYLLVQWILGAWELLVARHLEKNEEVRVGERKRGQKAGGNGIRPYRHSIDEHGKYG